MAQNMKKKMSKIPLWGQFAGAIGLTSAISRIGSTLVSAVSSARRFQRQMSEVNTIARLSARGLTLLSVQVKGLSTELGVTTDTITGGLYEALSAGVPQNNVIDFLRIATKASVAGVTDVKVAVDGLTSVINAYKMDASEAGRVSDIFFETIRLGKTKFDALSDSIGLVLPMANAVGVSFTELSAAFATMTKQGLSTDKTATALRGIMQGMLNPGDDLIKVIKAIEKELGISSIKSLTFQKQLALIGQKASDSGINLSALFKNVRATTGAFQLFGKNAKGAAKDLQVIANSLGSAEKAFKEFAGTADRELSKIEQKWEKIKRGFGTNLMKGIVFVLEPFLTTDYQAKIQAQLDQSAFTINYIAKQKQKREKEGLLVSNEEINEKATKQRKEDIEARKKLRKELLEVGEEKAFATKGSREKFKLEQKYIKLIKEEEKITGRIRAAEVLRNEVTKKLKAGEKGGVSLKENLDLLIAKKQKETAEKRKEALYDARGTGGTKEHRAQAETFPSVKAYRQAAKELKGLQDLRADIGKKEKANIKGKLKDAEIKSGFEKAEIALKERIRLMEILNQKGEKAAFIEKTLSEFSKKTAEGVLSPDEEKRITKLAEKLLLLKKGKKTEKKAGLEDEKKDFTALQLVGANMVKGAGGVGLAGGDKQRNILLGNINAGIKALQTANKKPPSLFDNSNTYA